MTLAYSSRLLYLCLAAFFLVHLAASMAALLLSPVALRRARRLAPRAAARLLFTLRLLPPALSLFVVAALCVPSYLWLEPEQSAEETGVICTAAALLGATAWSISIARAFRAGARSLQYVARCRRTGNPIHLARLTSPPWVIDEPDGTLALAGILRPRLFISRRVLTGLTRDQLSVALRHEDAHRASHDNLKRLLLLLSPGMFPFFHGLDSLERHWARLTEWAADDHAVEGDPRRCLSLAAALVRVARLGPPAYPSPIITSFLDDESGLAQRVERLLATPAVSEHPKSGTSLAPTAAIFALAGLIAALFRPSTFHAVHSLLEHLIR